jgi:hypothetical protein
MARNRPDRDKVRRLKGFATERSDYSPTKFYTSGTDQSGHGRPIRFDAAPSIVRSVTEIITSGDFPAYGTPSDFYRDALHHRIRFLLDTALNPRLAAAISETLEWREAEQEIANDRAKMAAYQAIRVDLLKLISSMRTIELPESYVSGVIEKHRANVEKLEEPYRSRLLATIDDLDPTAERLAPTRLAPLAVDEV